MDIDKRIKRIKEYEASMSDEDKNEILIRAKILTKDGQFHPKYFSKETIEKRKAVLKARAKEANKSKV